MDGKFAFPPFSAVSPPSPTPLSLFISYLAFAESPQAPGLGQDGGRVGGCEGEGGVAVLESREGSYRGGERFFENEGGKKKR
jgi:hypothetical protein